jgi:hypothetical protein
MRRPFVSLRFLTCNISQFSPISFVCSLPFFLKNALATLSKLGHRLRGGLVSEVAFGAVSNSLGADCLRGTHTKPVTYWRDRRENRLTRGRAMIRPK